eukprot:TRINITY_DN2860_c0_g1_i6.p1 TRINITY_DN2860_c0_g1~~TRINITY_DN2860_c0_g1_i6.p1  ORF type:complete len:179 (+),score=48.87 TRINITY_DN2860_c0_g1_i6:89-625(+)
MADQSDSKTEEVEIVTRGVQRLRQRQGKSSTQDKKQENPQPESKSQSQSQSQPQSQPKSQSQPESKSKSQSPSQSQSQSPSPAHKESKEASDKARDATSGNMDVDEGRQLFEQLSPEEQERIRHYARLRRSQTQGSRFGFSNMRLIHKLDLLFYCVMAIIMYISLYYVHPGGSKKPIV